MNATIRRIVWFAIVATSISFAISLVLGRALYAQSEGQPPVVIRDVVRAGSHDLSGMVTVPSPCEALSVKVEQINPASYYLDFQTWKIPYQACTNESVPRAFHIAVVAPSAGVEFSAGLNGRPFSVTVKHVREIPKK